MPSNGLVKLGGAGLAGAPLDRERASERTSSSGCAALGRRARRNILAAATKCQRRDDPGCAWSTDVTKLCEREAYCYSLEGWGRVLAHLRDFSRVAVVEGASQVVEHVDHRVELHPQPSVKQRICAPRPRSRET